MKHKTLLLLSLALLLASLGARHALAQTSNRTVIVYQGLVKEAGVPANAPVDMTWGIYDAETNGNLIAQGQVSQVQVQDGLFTLPMDLPSLGDNALPPPDGSPAGTWWMELCLRFPTLPSCQPFTRQRITPTVQALSARVASTVRDGAVTAAKLAADAVGTPNLQNGAVTGGKIANGNVLRSLNGLKDEVTLSVGEGLMLTPLGNELQLVAVHPCSDYTNCYWNLLGNGNIGGANFLGTVAGELDPLVFRVNDTHAMHIVPAGVSTPNIIGGHSGNNISVGVIGAHIGGGGEPGTFNSIEGNYDTIGGGSGHAIQKPSDYAAIGGGFKNTIQTNSSYSTIGGGAFNGIRPGARWSTVAGGIANAVGTNVNYGFIGGGTNNTILTTAVGAAIVGGQANSIQQSSTNSAIGGGARNVIQTSTDQATLAGGGDNTIRTDADSASVGGGSRNLIFASTPFATIPGGQSAAATNYGQFAYASGPFTAAGNGEAQLSFHVLRRTLTSAVTSELFLDGDLATRRMNLRPESTWTFDILVVARTDAGASAGYRITGLIKRPAVGAISFVPLAAPVPTTLGNDMGGGSVFVEADAVNNALVIKAVGPPGTLATRWVATVRTSEVIY